MSSTLKLKRAATGAIELRRGPFEVILDGSRVGSIDRHGTFELELGPGTHTLQVRAGRYSSPDRQFDALDGTQVNFRCNGAILWPQYVASLFVPTLGLRLKRE